MLLLFSVYVYYRVYVQVSSVRIQVISTLNVTVCCSAGVRTLALWVHFGLILGSFWVHFGFILGVTDIITCVTDIITAVLRTLGHLTTKQPFLT